MFGHQSLVVYLCVSECMMKVDYETFTSMSGTILPTMCQLLLCRVPYCQQCVNCWW